VREGRRRLQRRVQAPLQQWRDLLSFVLTVGVQVAIDEVYVDAVEAQLDVAQLLLIQSRRFLIFNTCKDQTGILKASDTLIVQNVRICRLRTISSLLARFGLI